jgi:hypothetical protein
MVDNDDQVAMSTLVGDLIDPDSTQPFETIDCGCNVVVDSGDDRPDRPPRHPQQLTGRTLGCPNGKPGSHRVEVALMAGVVSRPRNSGDRWAMGVTLDSWCVGFDEHRGRASVERSPAPPASTSVIAGRSTTVPPTTVASTCVWSDRHDDCVGSVVDADALDDGARQPARALPYSVVLHPVLLPTRHGFEPLDSAKPRSRQGATASTLPDQPTDRTGERDMGESGRVAAVVWGSASGSV